MQLLKTAHRRETIYYLPGDNSALGHPWSVKTKWVVPAKTTKKPHWVCNVSPGCVNGEDPWYDPAGVGLCFNPDITLSFTQPVLKIPPFFVNMGAVPPPDEGTLNTSGASSGNLSFTQKAPVVSSGCCVGEVGKLLNSCQVWLAQARTTFSVAVTTPGNLITGQIADYQVTYNSAAVDSMGSRVQIMTGASMPSPQQSTLEERLSGAYGDNGVDLYLIATIYFLSLQQDSPLFSAKVDNTWMAFVKHNAFWNLGYRTPNRPPVNLQQNPLDPALAFYLGQYVTPAAVIGSGQSLEQSVLAAVINANDNAGMFYTI